MKLLILRQVLSEENNHGMNVSKYEKEKPLIIIDSLEEYFSNQQPDMSFKRSLANYAKQMGKNGLSILGDIGAYPHKSMYKDLVDYELSLPTKYNDVALKGFCLYHQKDFNRFSDDQK